MPRRQILLGWLDAAAFYDQLDRDRAYDQLDRSVGKAAEGMGAQLMEDAARVILLLDEAAAAALGEPVILPPPTKTPPPPPDPKESWWKRLFGAGRRPKTELFDRDLALLRVLRAFSVSARSAYLNMFFATNHTFAGRSASRRMYHGNQYSP